MTENELRNYIKELSEKPIWWVTDKKLGKYFDIVEFGLALAEVVRKAERERCAELCVDKANSIESKVMSDTDMDDTANLRSTAWVINNLAHAIRGE